MVALCAFYLHKDVCKKFDLSSLPDERLGRNQHSINYTSSLISIFFDVYSTPLYFSSFLLYIDTSHLRFLMKALKPTVEWFNLGMYLGVNDSDLKEIEREQMGRVQDCKREMLVKWLICSDNPTVEQLISALWETTHP